MIIEPVGWVSSPRREAIDDDWGDVTSTITLDDRRYSPEALWGLDHFSHIEVVFLFDRVDSELIQTAARHPRNNEDWPRVGIFAQRAKNRPNRLGLSVCRLLGVEGLSVTVQALDAIDGTPVIDIKPYMAEFAPRGEVQQPAWSHELMAAYWHAGTTAPPPATWPEHQPRLELARLESARLESAHPGNQVDLPQHPL